MRKLCASVVIFAVAALGVPIESSAGSKSVRQQAQGTVNGVLKDLGGNTIANATLNVRDASGNLVATVTTDSEGKFTFTAPTGTYTLQLVSAGGRSLVSGSTVTVVQGTTAITVVAAREALGGLSRGEFGLSKGKTIAIVAITAAGLTLIAIKALQDDASPSR